MFKAIAGENNRFTYIEGEFHLILCMSSSNSTVSKFNYPTRLQGQAVCWSNVSIFVLILRYCKYCSLINIIRSRRAWDWDSVISSASFFLLDCVLVSRWRVKLTSHFPAVRSDNSHLDSGRHQRWTGQVHEIAAENKTNQQTNLIADRVKTIKTPFHNVHDICSYLHPITSLQSIMGSNSSHVH